MQLDPPNRKLVCGSTSSLVSRGGERGGGEEDAGEETKVVTLVNGDHLLDLRQVCVVVGPVRSHRSPSPNDQGKLEPVFS
jgi:hypothetical protein